MKAYLALMAVASVLIVLVTIERPITERRFAARSLDAEFQGAIAATQAALARNTAEIVRSEQLGQNLEWQLGHSVDQFLAGRRKPGVLDAVQIFDESCARVAHTEAAAGQDCPRGQFTSAREKEALYWSRRGELPVMALATRVTLAGKPFMMLTEVELNDSWLGAMPQFAELATSYEAAIGTADRAQVGTTVATAARGGGSSRAVLTSRDPWFVYMPSFILGEAELLGGLIHMAGLSVFALAFFCLYQARRKADGAARELSDFLEWCRALGEPRGGGSGRGGRARSRARGERLADARVIIQAAMEKTFAQLRGERTEAETRGQRIGELERELVQTKRQLAERTGLESLSEQLAEGTVQFVADLERTIGAAEDVSDALVHGLAREAQILGSLTGRWQSELGESTPRKFLRSLSERPAPEGGSMLDRDLAILFSATSRVGAQSIHLSIEIERILQELRQTTKTATHWRSLCSPRGHSGDEPTLFELITEGQSLVRFVSGLPRYEFRPCLDSDPAVPELGLDRGTWRSLFYHVAIALIDSSRSVTAEPIEVQTRLKSRLGQTLVVFSAHAPQNTPADLKAVPLSSEALRHLDLARQLVFNHPLKLTALPAVSGIPPIAVCWQDDARAGRGEDAAKGPPATFAKPEILI